METLPKPELHLLDVPADPEAKVQALVALFRKLTGRDPAPEDLAECRRTLGLAPEPPAEPARPSVQPS